MHNHSFPRRKKGQILVIMLIVMAVSLTMSAVVLYQARSYSTSSRLQVDADKASSLARSGLGIAESFLAKDTCLGLATFDQTYTIGEGTVQIKILPADETIASTGRIEEAVKVLEKTYVLPVSEGWVKTYGDAENNYIACGTPISDGGYILGGVYGSEIGASGDFLVVKLKADYSVDWAKTYGGADRDNLWCMKQTADDGFIFAGFTKSFGAGGGLEDGLVIKTNSLGEIAWTKTYGTATSTDRIYSIEETNDGGYVFAGLFSLGGNRYDVLVIKTDDQGNVLNPDPPTFITWANAYGGNVLDHQDHFRGLYEQPNGKVVIASASYSYDVGGSGTIEIIMYRLNTDGTVARARCIYDTSGFGLSANSLLKTSDGGYLMGGTRSPGGGLMLLKITSDLLSNEWCKVVGAGEADPYGEYLRFAADGGLICSGIRFYNGFDLGFQWPHPYICNLDDTGTFQWGRTYNATKIAELRTTDSTAGTYNFCGETGWDLGGLDFVLMQTDSTGEIDCCNDMFVDSGPLTEQGITTGNSGVPSKVDITDIPVEYVFVETNPDITPVDITADINTICPE